MNRDKVWILGPCSMESQEIFSTSLHKIDQIMTRHCLINGGRWFFKCSFDKANRTSIKGARGPGLDFAIALWKKYKQHYPHVQFITDVHECWQVEKLVGAVDAIQIPAFLCRQTDLLVECAKHFDIINVKRMQHLGPNNLNVLVDKLKETNPNCEAWLCDRGSNYGYDHLIADFTIVDVLKKSWDKVLLDATHSVQHSRAIYGNQGERALAERYLLAADIFNYDGVFAEVHPNPPCAISDGDCQIYLKDLERLVEKANKISKVLKR